MFLKLVKFSMKKEKIDYLKFKKRKKEIVFITLQRIINRFLCCRTIKQMHQGQYQLL